MSLETMEPTPTWDSDAHGDTVETLAAHDDLTYRVWGGDWCKDCRAVLPDFAAALDAAGVPEDRIEQYPVEREDGEKVGPKVEEYGIELIPTIIVERNGDEVARFVESADRPAAAVIADQLDELDATA
ncbi:thioredoxin family protein [Halostella salina]|uniref:thioredoxin family protein n=1 Tax=Halostella salina TaxID=1547897 RepID=UPI000EF7AD68|nr:thioredoxin family protein [Halostella salina]